MDWVHCNMCFVQPGDVEGKKFSITNCGHIYCAECLQLPQLKECKICHIKYNTMPLTPKMTPEVEAYFHDPIQNIQKQIKILEFQQNHRIRLVSHNRDRISSYKQLKAENYSLKEEIKRLREDNTSLREDNRRKREEISQYKKKLEYLAKHPQIRKSQISPITNSTHPFTPKDLNKISPKITPRMTPASSMFSVQSNASNSEMSQNMILKRPPGSSEFFLSGRQKSNDNLFTPPIPPKFSGSYRNIKNSTPDVATPGTPATPESSIRDNTQKDPLQRKIKLPDRLGPSPATKIGLHRLTLSRPTSTPNKDSSVTSKYLRYF